MSKHKRKTRVVITKIEVESSVRLAKFPGFDIRITPENRIFFLNGDSAYFPTMAGSTRVVTDFPGAIPENVYKQLFKLLTVQASVRLHQRRNAEDEDYIIV